MLKTWRQYFQHLGVMGCQKSTLSPSCGHFAQLLVLDGHDRHSPMRREHPPPALACHHHHRSPAPSQRSPQPSPSPRSGVPALPIALPSQRVAPARCTALTSRRHMPRHTCLAWPTSHMPRDPGRSTPTPRPTAAPAMRSAATMLILPLIHHFLSTQLPRLATPIIIFCRPSLSEQLEPAGGAPKNTFSVGRQPSKYALVYLGNPHGEVGVYSTVGRLRDARRITTT